MRYVRIIKQHGIHTCLIQLATFNLQIYVELINIITQQIVQRCIRNFLSSYASWSGNVQTGQIHTCQFRSLFTTAFIEIESQFLNITSIIVQ